MIEQIRGLSFVAYTYEGGEPLRFTVTFPFLKQEHVRVLVGDPESPRTVTATWIDETTLSIPDQSEFLEAPYSVMLRRYTPVLRAEIEFRDGAKLPAKELNKAIRQLLYAQQEMREFGLDGSGLPGGGLPGGGPGNLPDINTIIDQITQSPAFLALQERINLSEINGETLLNEILRSHGFNESEREIRLIAAMHGENIAAVSERLDLVTSESEATVNWIQQYAAGFGVSADGTLTAATVTNLINARATRDEAEAIAQNSVAAFAGGQFAALQQTYHAYVNANDNRWSSTWSLKVEGGDPNNPIVGGIALSANPNGSDFVVQVDRFAIVTPAGPGGTYAARKFPFVVGTVGGLSTVGITGQLLVDGSITANKITTTTLSAITANLGTVNGGTFKTHTLDANGNVPNPLEFRAEMTNVGTWPLWVGSGVKNENNAVFWVDRSGNAGFKGRVSAPNIHGEFQTAVAVNWTGAATLSNQPYSTEWLAKPEFTSVAQFTLPAAVLVGETHTPCVNLTVNYSADTPGIIVIVEELRTSVWVEIGRYEAPVSATYLNSPGGAGEPYYTLLRMPTFTSQAIVVCVGQPTSAARTIRVRARYRDIPQASNNPNPPAWARSAPVNVTSITGFVYGLR